MSVTGVGRCAVGCVPSESESVSDGGGTSVGSSASRALA